MAARSWGHVFLECFARNINPFLWEMLCKDGSSKCLGSIVLMETRCGNDRVSEQLLFIPHICDFRAHHSKAQSFSPSSLPSHLSFEHHVHHQELGHHGGHCSVCTWGTQGPGWGSQLTCMGPGRLMLTGQSSRNLCYPILMWKVPVLQHLDVYKRFVLQSLVQDTCIKAITKNASGS